MTFELEILSGERGLLEPEEATPVLSPEELRRQKRERWIESRGAQLREEQRLRVSMKEAAPVDGDKAAKLQDLGRRMRMPPRLVEGREREVEDQLAFDDFDFAALRQQAPVLAREMEDPEFAKIAKDDVETLANFESVARVWMNRATVAMLKPVQGVVDTALAAKRYLGEGGVQFAAGNLQTEYGNLTSRAMRAEKGFGTPLDPVDWKRITEIEKVLPAFEIPGEWGGLWEGAPLQASRQVPVMWDMTKHALGGATFMGALGFVAARGPGMKHFAKVGAAGGTFYSSFNQNAGPLWRELRQMRDENGNPLNPDTVWGLAAFGGTLMAALDAFSFGKTAGTLKPVKDAIRRRMMRISASKTMREAVAGWAWRYGKAVATETWTEGAQNVVEVLMEDVGKLILLHNQDISDGILAILEDENLEAFLQRSEKAAFAGARAGFQASMILSGTTSAVSLTTDVVQAYKAQADMASLQEAGKRLRGSKLFNRSRESFERFATQALDGDRDPNVYLDAGPFLQTLRDENIDPRPVLRALGIESQLPEYQETGKDPRVPLSRILSLSDQPYFDLLLMDLRSSLDATTPRRGQRLIDDLQQELQVGEEARELVEEETGQPAPDIVDPLEAARDEVVELETGLVGEAADRAGRIARTPPREALEASADRIEMELRANIDIAARKLKTQGAFEAAPFNARLIAEHFKAMGALLGEDPYKLYRMSGLEIRGPLQAKRTESQVIDILDSLRRTAVAQEQIAGIPRPEMQRFRKALSAIRRGKIPTGGRFKRYPVIDMLKRWGGINPRSEAAGELRNLGVTAKQFPGLFRRKRAKGSPFEPMGKLDQIVRDEEPLFQGRGEDSGKVQQQEIIDAIRAELANEPYRTEEETQQIQEVTGYYEGVQRILDELELDPQTMTNDQIIRAIAAVEVEGVSPTERLRELLARGAIPPGLQDQVERALDELGIDPNELSNEAILARLREAEQMEGALTLFQPAYHGTRHRFEKFMLEHIGTGQGAQTYGWGLYFASLREVAESYRKIGGRTDQIQLDGKPLISSAPRLLAGVVHRDELKAANLTEWQAKELAFIEAVGSLEEAIERVKNALMDLEGDPTNAAERIEWFRNRLQALESLRGRISFKKRGQIYKVDIPEDRELLDWDKPLSEQSPDVLKKLTTRLPATEWGSEGQLVTQQDIDSGMRFGAWYTSNVGSGASDPRSLSMGLLDAGIPGLRYLDQGSRKAGEGTYNYVIWDENAIRVLDTFYQAGPEGPRGFITFNPERTRALIRLLQTADASTVLHETGHFLLESLRRFAVVPGAPDQLRADWQTIANFLGVEGDADLTTEQHELFTEQWEAYLATGRAPTLRLREVFERFRLWLRAIWQGIRRQQIEVDPDVAEVFDRLLATPRDLAEKAIRDEEQARVQASPAYRALQDLSAGMDPETAGNAWGFTPEELLAFEARDPDWERIIDDRTRERVRRELQEEIFDVDAYVGQVGREAIYTDRRAEALNGELMLLQAQAGLPREPGVSARLRRTAQQMMGAKVVRDIRPAEYQAEEQRAASEALNAARRGQFDISARAKERQILMHHLFVSSKQARTAIDRQERFFGRFNRPGIRKAIVASKGEHMAQIDGLRARFGLTARRLDEGRMSFSNWVKQQKDKEGVDILVEWAEQPPDADGTSRNLLTDEAAKNWQDLTLEEVAGLRDTMAQIEKLAKDANRIWTDEQNRQLDEVVDGMTGSIYGRNKTIPDGETYSRTAKEKFKHGLDVVHAEHTKMEFLWDWLDAWNPRGVVWTTLGLPVQRAFEAEVEMLREVGPALDRIFSRYTREDRRGLYSYKRIMVPEIGKSFKKIELLCLWLNWGNEGNREAIRRGDGWTDEQVMAALSHLSPKDLETGQLIWDFLEQFREPIGRLEYELNGVRLKWVEADPVTVNGVTYRGGYYPLAYDPERRWLTFKRAELEKGQLQTNYLRLMTRDGHRRARVGSAGQVVQKDISVLTNHVWNVIHDLTHTKVLRDLYRLTEDERFRKAVETTHGEAGYRLIKPYLRNLARDLTDPYDFMDHVLSHAIAGTTVMSLGFKVSSIIQQPLGIFVAWDYMNVEPGFKGAMSGSYYLWNSVRKFYSRPDLIPEKVRFVFERSTEMRARPRNMEREIRNLAKRSSMKGLGADRNAVYFLGMAWAEFSISIPTWLGAYEQGMSSLFKNDPDCEQKAIDWANKVVRNTQGSGAIKDLAKIVRGGPKKRFLTMFYTAFSGMYNSAARRLDIFRRNPMPTMPAFVLFLGGAWFAQALLSEWLSGQGPEDDEEWTTWAWKSLLLHPSSMVIGLRDLVRAFVHPEYGYELSPAGDALKAGIRAGKKIQQQAEDYDPDRSTLQALVYAAGYLGKKPFKQAWYLGEELWESMAGADSDFNWRNAAYGRDPRDRP